MFIIRSSNLHMPFICQSKSLAQGTLSFKFIRFKNSLWVQVWSVTLPRTSTPAKLIVRSDNILFHLLLITLCMNVQ